MTRTVNDTAELRLRQWARLPPAEILAVVTVAPVPQIPPTALREVLEPVVDQRATVGWRLAPAAALRPDLLTEFWAWRRRWTASWSMGPVTNIAALADVAEAAGHPLEPELATAIAAMCAAEHDDQRFGDPHLEPLMVQVDPLRRAVEAASADPQGPLGHGTAIIDDMPRSAGSATVLRSWPPVSDEPLVLAAAGDTSVMVRAGEGLVVVHGEPRSHAFTHVSSVDLTGDQAIVVDEAGTQLVLENEEARPIGWLTPTSLRWHLEPIPLVAVWNALLTGLPDAAAAAALADTSICFTSDLTHM